MLTLLRYCGSKPDDRKEAVSRTTTYSFFRPEPDRQQTALLRPPQVPSQSSLTEVIACNSD